MKLGIVIPTYNEKKNIKKIFQSFKKLKKIQYFICFVDGSSTNETQREIKKYFKKNFTTIKEKKKKISFFTLSTRCAASFLGFKWILRNTKCNPIVDMDADLSSNPLDIYKALKIFDLKKADLIIASKYLKKSKIVGRKLLRTFCSYIYSNCCKIVISNKISDYSNGYRFFSRKVLKALVKIEKKYDSPSQHLENLIFCFEKQYTIYEIPATYIDTGKDSGSIKIGHLFIFAYQIFEILIRYKLKKFFH